MSKRVQPIKPTTSSKINYVIPEQSVKISQRKPTCQLTVEEYQETMERVTTQLDAIQASIERLHDLLSQDQQDACLVGEGVKGLQLKE